jgi:hypothetical protein
MATYIKELKQPQTQEDIDNRNHFVIESDKLLLLAKKYNISVLFVIDPPQNAMGAERKPYMPSNITEDSSFELLAMVVSSKIQRHPGILTMPREDGPC